MGLRITSNIFSLGVQRNLANTTRALARSLQRLSSGSRINTGRDDPAGLAMASGLEAQRRGMLQAIRNINDARSFLDTADGALMEQTRIIQRMRELAVQSSNGTITNTERSYLNLEFQKLLTEFDRISNETTFNGTKLLNGSISSLSIQVGAQKNQTFQIALPTILSGDVLAASSSTTSTLGSGTFTAASTFSTGRTYDSEFGDINGDGKADFVYGLNSVNIGIRLGNGNGTFMAASTLSSTQSRDFELSDFNGDGLLDILATNTSINTVGLFIGNGNGTFQTATTFAGDSTIYGIESGDFNGDGKVDFLSSNYSNSSLNVYLGNGNGTFMARTTIASGSYPQSIESSDFNGDGQLDLVVPRYTTNFVTVCIGNGNGTFQGGLSITSEANPVNPAVADFNGDGKIDIVVCNETASTMSIWFGNGNGTFTAQTTYAAGITPINMSATDLNGDGNKDIIITNRNTNSISIFMGNGNGMECGRIFGVFQPPVVMG